MPENIKALRNRIRSIRKTKKITRAMEMVSAAKLRKSESVMKAARPFMQKIQTLLAHLALSTGAQEHALFKQSDTGVDLLVVMTSDRGLCGAFNATILRRAVAELRENPDLKVLVLGRKGRDYLRRYFADRIIKEMVDLDTNLDGRLTDDVAGDLLNGFMDGRYRKIDILYPHYISTVANKPVIERYIPLEPTSFGVSEEDAKHAIDYILEPSPDRVFEAVLPRYLKSKIYLLFAETFTSEHSARMMAMNNATKNCDELSSMLTLRMNKARQASITTEIIEIVSGAEALNG